MLRSLESRCDEIKGRKGILSDCISLKEEMQIVKKQLEYLIRLQEKSRGTPTPLRSKEDEIPSRFQRSAEKDGDKLEIPKFNGRDPAEWILRAESNFALNQLTTEEKIEVSMKFFEGDALRWFNWENRRRPFIRWEGLKLMLLRQFPSTSKEPLYEQFLVKKQATVNVDYTRPFVALASSPKGEPEEILVKQRRVSDEGQQFLGSTESARDDTAPLPLLPTSIISPLLPAIPLSSILPSSRRRNTPEEGSITRKQLQNEKVEVSLEPNLVALLWPKPNQFSSIRPKPMPNVIGTNIYGTEPLSLIAYLSDWLGDDLHKLAPPPQPPPPPLPTPPPLPPSLPTPPPLPPSLPHLETRLIPSGKEDAVNYIKQKIVWVVGERSQVTSNYIPTFVSLLVLFGVRGPYREDRLSQNDHYIVSALTVTNLGVVVAFPNALCLPTTTTLMIVIRIGANNDVNNHLIRKSCCETIRKDLQFWVLDNLMGCKDCHDHVLSYLDLMIQTLMITAGIIPSISISSTLSEMNIYLNFKEVDASTPFGVVFYAGFTQRHVGATSLAQEIQKTGSLFGNLVDETEEIQHARFLTNLDEHLYMELYFFDPNNLKKAVVTLKSSYLKRDTCPSEIVPGGRTFWKHEPNLGVTLIFDIEAPNAVENEKGQNMANKGSTGQSCILTKRLEGSHAYVGKGIIGCDGHKSASLARKDEYSLLLCPLYHSKQGTKCSDFFQVAFHDSWADNRLELIHLDEFVSWQKAVSCRLNEIFLSWVLALKRHGQKVVSDFRDLCRNGGDMELNWKGLSPVAAGWKDVATWQHQFLFSYFFFPP